MENRKGGHLFHLNRTLNIFNEYSIFVLLKWLNIERVVGLVTSIHVHITSLLWLTDSNLYMPTGLNSSSCEYISRCYTCTLYLVHLFHLTKVPLENVIISVPVGLNTCILYHLFY